MNELVGRFDAWHKTKLGYAVMAVVELGLAYIIVSLAIDSGSLFQYFIATVLFIGGVRNLWMLVKRAIRG